MNFNIAEITGYVGTFFLITRLFPLIYEQLKSPKKINISFLIIEFFACIFLGISAIFYNATPFIVANILSFINLSIILSIQFKIRCQISEEDDEILSIIL
ncbi:hypothetical protein JO84_gp096 [Aureococcus anophagefferens virus]|uniref:Uncharacterized protein n=1 Tax=Aureococcus anophagefferens virus TaxID=1474867 RepID=A0A076FMB5_9VIRU|nr:hypothetical protein JO84_gp096 [Aureococcus anophagefferens virus]AII17043.1 hypothetical protein AaV_385 [Aureococcus anophagefferens virus]UOG94296.1 hypothetical protein MKD35_261 [Aureococcus anophagefferens virus]